MRENTIEEYTDINSDLDLKVLDKHEVIFKTITAKKRIRDYNEAINVKKLYIFKCQVCNQSLQLPTSQYAETAHIKPHGYPHLGSDNSTNMLCLCPNHHKLFDKGGFIITNDYTIKGLKDFKKLIINPKHKIDPASLEYHRKMFVEFY